MNKKSAVRNFHRFRKAGFCGILAVCTAAATLTFATKAHAQETSISRVSLSTETKQRMVLSPGIIWTVYFDDAYKNVAIGDTRVVDAFPLTESSLYIQTKEVGLTNLTIFGEQDEYMGEIEIQIAIDKVEPKLQALINDAVPGSTISVSVINNRIYLKGNVAKPDDIPIVLDIAQTYAASSEPLVYSISYPEHINPRTTIRVIRDGGATPYTTAIGGVENTGNVLIQYGTIKARKSEDFDTSEDTDQNRPVVINIGGQESTPSN
ncbi:pilus assembly protein N-terminal domain-containing protein [Aestuariicoccus sp. MJ-SS9]|uniref:pilus assembly protein N-terminal domain-containing protein n=1 Tax=Aestuariicoccus sp. MJ-SS9 TaxID=3079855 RepID=UPI00290C1782|nr:pilus assembly protein N-terminal domain-containing protein [Aestuariicoccus sp. MJ-SS9]MDU8913261.1 pilus assembly protein N-terminal domain-containing protein [Aestuariicoccus sp. MJ-SS9]